MTQVIASDTKATVQPLDNERLIEATRDLTTKLDEFLERLEELAERIEYGVKEAPGGGFQYD